MFALLTGTCDKNVNVTTIMFLTSGDLTELCLYIYICNLVNRVSPAFLLPRRGVSKA